MICLTFARQILNLLRDVFFVIFYTGTLEERKNLSLLKKASGYGMLFLILVMYSAEGNSIFAYASVRTLFRFLCFFAFLSLSKDISMSLAAYDALFINTICTITHNFFLTPLTRPILLNMTEYTENALLNWGISFLIVNVVALCFYYIVYKMIPLNHIRIVNKTRAVSLCIFMTGSIYLNNTLRSITDVKLEQIAELSTYALISQLTLFGCVIFLEQIQWKTQKELDAQMDAVSTRAMLENIEKQIESDDKIRQIRHDLKNHLNTIYSFVQEDRKEECLSYIDRLSDDYTRPRIMIQTGNKVLDNIISQKLSIAAEKNIVTSFSADFSVLGFLGDTDACIIFANLLDNAIEAAEKVENPENRYIDIRGAAKENQYIYRIENSFTGSVLSQNNRFRSTKTDPLGHGIGLKSVFNAVKKYDGLLYLEADEEKKRFRAVITFINTNHVSPPGQGR